MACSNRRWIKQLPMYCAKLDQLHSVSLPRKVLHRWTAATRRRSLARFLRRSRHQTHVDTVFQQVRCDLIDLVLLKRSAIEPLAKILESHCVEATHLVSLGHSRDVAVIECGVVRVTLVYVAKGQQEQSLCHEQDWCTHLQPPAHPPPSRGRHRSGPS